MYVAWGFAALATLSKGLEAVVLPGAVFLLYVLITRDWARFKQLHFVGGLLIYLLIAAPWFLLVSLRNPEFPQFFFIHEHFERFLTTVHHRVEPWWFFIPILLFGLWCFLPQFIRALVRFVIHELVVRYLSRKTGETSASEREPTGDGALRPCALPVAVVRFHLPVLLALRFQARQLHPADLPGAGPAAGARARAAAAAAMPC